MCSRTCDFVAGTVMSVRNYFRPSNGLSEPTGSIGVALKSREQRTLSLPCARSAEYFLRPVTVYFIVASYLPIAKTANTPAIPFSSFFTATAY